MKISLLIRKFLSIQMHFLLYLNKNISESEDRLQSNQDYCFKDEIDIVKDFNQIPDAVENTLIIAKKCSFFP